MRKTLTHEQKASRDERKARFKALWKQVAAMPESERLAMSARLGIVTADGRALSMGNMCLVAMQNPTATVVGGFRQWLKQGRCVKKGEHGAMIWVPLGGKTTEVGPENEDAEDESESGKSSKSRARFIIGTVFDIGQTEEKAEGPVVVAAGAVDLENIVFEAAVPFPLPVPAPEIAPSIAPIIPIPPVNPIPASRPSWRRAA